MRRRLLLTGLLATPALAQEARPLRILVGFPPGSGLDIMARVVAERLGPRLQRPALVENRPGGGGRVAAEALARATGDTGLLMMAPSIVPVYFPFLYSNLPFDPVADLAPVAMVSTYTLVLAVRADHPARDLAGFIAWAKQRGDRATYGSLSAGTATHFLGVMFNNAVGTRLTHVPYRGSSPLAVALLAGEVHSGLTTTASIVSQLADGSIRALAVSGATRSPLLPNVPAFAEISAELAEMGKAELWYGTFANGKAPAAEVQRIGDAIVQVLAEPEVVAKLRQLDLPPRPVPPAPFAAVIQDDIRRWGPIIRSTGFKLED